MTVVGNGTDSSLSSSMVVDGSVALPTVAIVQWQQLLDMFGNVN